MKDFIFYCLLKNLLASVLLDWFLDILKFYKFYKENLLSEDDSSLNISSYVYFFRHKSSEACELAQNNLRSVQSKMKERYDKYTQSRSFQPGDKVLAQEIRF